MRTNNTMAGRTPVPTAEQPPNMLISVPAFLIFTILWLAFGAALLFNRGALDSLWNALQDLPWLAQGIVWLLLLPVMAGLWIWETDWTLWVRLLLVAGLAVANIVAFYPWRSQTRQGV